jgi:hypothetical protein
MLIRCNQLNFGSEFEIRCRIHMHFQFLHIIYHKIPTGLHGFNMNTHMHSQCQHIVYHQIPAELHGFNMNTYMHSQFQHNIYHQIPVSFMILT